jgi:hypothetical protein
MNRNNTSSFVEAVDREENTLYTRLKCQPMRKSAQWVLVYPEFFTAEDAESAEERTVVGMVQTRVTVGEREASAPCWRKCNRGEENRGPTPPARLLLPAFEPCR